MTERGRESREARDKRTEPHDIDELSSGPPRKKNTKKWCKGKVGREHVPSDWIPMRWFSPGTTPHYHHKVCLNCNKTLDYRFRGLR